MATNVDASYKRNRILKSAGFLLLFFACLLIIALVITTSPEIQEWYSKYQDILYNFELKVAAIDYQYLILIVIFLLFLIKSFVPIITVSAICMLSGMVFPTSSALLINISGIILMLTVKYKYGKNRGGGSTGKLVGKVTDRSETLRFLIEHKGEGNPWLLFIFRLVPGFPINSISQIYGSMNFNYKSFLLLSLLGLAPKIFSYTFIGRNVYDPLSWHFFLPMIILLLISGISMLGLNALINYIEKS